MPKAKTAKTSWGSFVLSVAVVWMAASIAAYFYAQQQHIPAAVASAVLPAFLVELMFYLAPGFESVRGAFARAGTPAMRALLLTMSAVLPYSIATLLLGDFRIQAFLALAALAAVLSFWYARAGRGALADAVFLMFAAGIFLGRFFAQIYPTPAPRVPLEILGRLMWIRVGVMASLTLRGIDAGFGFLPSGAEWRVGIEQYLLFLPVGGAIAWLLGLARFHPATAVWWKFPALIAGWFFGVLWVVALGEEFFFRGFLQQSLARAWNNGVAALAAASALFGAVHLPYRGFPNWRFAALASTAGLFYGIAFMRTRSVRASMVTHALVVTTWKTLFAG